MKLDNVMVDIETLGTQHNAVVLSIGAVFFCPKTGAKGEEFYAVINYQSCLDAGRTVDNDTLKWWTKQGDSARELLTQAANGHPLVEVLNAFTAYLHRNSSVGKVQFWGNGAAFDNVIVADCYTSNGLSVPWKFWNDRCFRTMKALNKHVKHEFVGVPHNALDDARNQANHLIKIMEK